MLDRGNGHPVALRLGRVVIVGYLDCDGDPGAALDAAARGGTGDLIQLRQVCMASSFGQRATLGDGDIRLGGIDAYYTEAAAA